jgi:hypothetical protein
MVVRWMKMGQWALWVARHECAGNGGVGGFSGLPFRQRGWELRLGSGANRQSPIGPGYSKNVCLSDKKTEQWAMWEGQGMSVWGMRRWWIQWVALQATWLGIAFVFRRQSSCADWPRLFKNVCLSDKVRSYGGSSMRAIFLRVVFSIKVAGGVFLFFLVGSWWICVNFVWLVLIF